MGNVLINVDLSQAELRCMALFSNDEWMINALQEGRGDFFDNFLMPVAFPAKLAHYGDVARWKENDPVDHKESRTKCKAVQYGLAFGRQANAIALALKMPVREAQLIIDNYLTTASNFARWRQDVMEAAINPSKRDLLINPFGRRFQSEVITPRRLHNIQREALSFLPQSTSSDICLSTGIRINPWLKNSGYRIFNIVHDALMIEGPEKGSNTIGEFVAYEMRRTGKMVFGDKVPFLAEYSIGKSWSDLD
jgi:DNA polymerase-1